MSAPFAIRCSTRAPRIGPVGALSPSAFWSVLLSGRSQTKNFFLTTHASFSRDVSSVVSGRASAKRRTSSQSAIARQQAPGFSLQNCSNLDAGELAGGAVSFDGEPGVAPPVWGAAAPPCGVLGFD